MRLFVLLLLLLLPIAVAKAQGDIHRCVGADGRPVFTDRVCSDVDAKPVLPPASASTMPVSPMAPALPPPPVLCAADMEHLKQAVVDAFAVHNPNRLAGLVLWNGAGQQAVVANIRAFTRLMARPLVEVDAESSDDDVSSYDDGDSSGTTAFHSGAHGGALVIETEGDDGYGDTQAAHFDVVHHAGCLWLRPAD
jgi:hypothetical protein